MLWHERDWGGGGAASIFMLAEDASRSLPDCARSHAFAGANAKEKDEGSLRSGCAEHSIGATVYSRASRVFCGRSRRGSRLAG